MSIAIVILWSVWLIPMFLYMIWKRGDWYLFIIPPTFTTIIALCISIFSVKLGIISIIGIHIFLIVSSCSGLLYFES